MMNYMQYTKGLFIIGKLTEFDDGETIAYFLTPEGQALVRDTFVEHAKRAHEADLKDGGDSDTSQDGVAAFDRLNDLVQFKLKKTVEAVVEEVEVEQQTKAQALAEKRDQVHVAGTTAEIAATLGVSKSEVRKMKREGTLDTALTQKAQS